MSICPPEHFFCFRRSPRRLGVHLYLSVDWGACQDGEGGRSRVLSYKQWDSSGKCWLPNKGRQGFSHSEDQQGGASGTPSERLKEHFGKPPNLTSPSVAGFLFESGNTSLSNVCPQKGTQDSEGRAQKAKSLPNGHGKKP